MFFIKLFYAILLIGLGILILKYRRFVKSWTGNFVWAEQYIGRGGTYLIIILIAIGMIFFGLILMFGRADFLLGGSGDVGTTKLHLNH